MRRAAPALGALLVAGTLAAANGGGGALAGRLSEEVARGGYGLRRSAPEAIRFGEPPQLLEVGAAGERRQAVVTSLGQWWWRGRVPPGARLAAAAQLVDGHGTRLVVTVTVVRPLERQLLCRAAGSSGWLPLVADLSHLAGQQVELEVRAEARGVAAAPLRVAWAPFDVVSGASAGRPNLVLVLVDTLRADRLTAYGAPRALSPNVQALLAERGVVVEHAYAPSPWTIPSVLALLASRAPGELLGTDMATFGLPDQQPTLPAVLRGLGYETAGFLGNPTVHAGNGFARGFATVYSPESLKAAMIDQHADHLTRLMRRWLASSRRRPFFLFAHYVDPHDPYDNPDLVDGRSPFFPDYRGTLSGRWIHGVFLGKLPLRDPASDIRHLRALYDSEVRYFDRYLGELLAAFDPQTLANTLFVLTADHGEELHEHGGWKHGRTLYEEQLRVPLLWRWDGRLPARVRRPGPVRLIDVAPTLVAAAGGTTPASWQGRDLLPWLRGQAGAAPRPEPLFAQHFADGPVRAAVLAGGWKLIAFDRHQRFAPANEHQALLYQQELARLARLELYDLRRDPGEQRNLAAAQPEVVRRLAPVLHRRLAAQHPGLRVLLAGAVAGERVEVVVRFQQAPPEWASCFLGEHDAVVLKGDRLRLSLVGEAMPKGVRLVGAVPALAEVTVIRPGPLRVRLGSGEAYGGGPIAAARLAGEEWPGDGGGAQLLLWAPPAVAGPRREADPETLRRLEALGYAG